MRSSAGPGAAGDRGGGVLPTRPCIYGPDADLWLRHAAAAAYASTQGMLPPAACLAPSQRGHELLPRSSEAAHTRALCLEANDDVNAARQLLAAAREHDPTNLDRLLLAGVLAAREGDPDGAETLLLRATELDPDQPAAWRDLAVLYEQVGRGADAAAARDRAAQLSHSD